VSDTTRGGEVGYEHPNRFQGHFELKNDFNDSMNCDPGQEVVVFTEALKVPVRERAAFLDLACGGDVNLRHKVEALLRAHDHVGNFLEEPPAGKSIE
jgi:hypothetical protein